MDLEESELRAGPGEPEPDHEPHPDAGEPDARPRRWWVLVALAAVAVVLLAVVAVSERDREAAPQPPIPLDTWVPYWALETSAAEIAERSGSMREVSPFWFRAAGVGRIEQDPNTPAALAEDFLDKTGDALVVPSVVDGLGPREMAAILADPLTRARHVEALVEFARSGDYAGIDLDYESFAFSDGRDTWVSTRPGWVAFVSELGAALRAEDLTLTVSVPPVYDAGRTPTSGYWVYDYGAIVDHVDRIRIMAYDYSFDAPGPIAPLSFVQEAIDGAVAATGRPEKLVLGVPAYGRNWPVGVSGTCPEPGSGVDVPGITSVTVRNVDELVARRGAVPTYDPVTAEWWFEYPLEITDGTTTCVQTRRVHYVDGEGIRRRAELAEAAGLGGVALWALGFEDDAVWEALLREEQPAATTTQPG